MMDTAYVAGVRQQINFPNWLTVSRVLLTVPVVILGVVGWYRAAMFLIAVAAITDGLDGYLARQWGQSTPLGRVGDPLADKFFVDFTLLAAGIVHESAILLGLWVLTLAYDSDNTWQRRGEIARALLNLKGDQADLPASLVSKSKTALLFVLIWLAYAPGSLLPLPLLELIAIMTAGAVSYSWFGNRKDWLRQKFFSP